MAFPERIYAGATTTVIGYAREQGRPKDITGWQVKLTLAGPQGQKQEVLGAVVDGPQGLFHIVIPKDLELVAGRWEYEVALTSGDEEYVASRGTLDVVSRL